MTLGLNAAQLARMRSQVSELLPGTAILQSPTNTPDSMGGVSQTYAAAGTVLCRLDPLGSKSERVAALAGRETLTKMYQLTLPYDATVANDYRVVIASQTYQVVQLDNDHSWNVSVRAIVSEVE